MVMYRQEVAKTFNEIRVKSRESESGVVSRFNTMKEESFLVFMVGERAIVPSEARYKILM